MITYGPNLGLIISATTGEQYDSAFRQLLRALDALVLLRVQSRTLTAPPGAPGNGVRYIVGAAPTGAWSGHANAVAVWTTDDPATPLGYWEFHTPAEGWLAWSQADAAAYSFTSGAWTALINPSSFVTSVAGRGGAVTLAESDITSLTTDLAATEKSANKGVASGYASLDGTGHVPIAQIPGGGGGGGAPTAIAGVNNQTGTAYTLILGDAGFLIRMNNAAANACTIPPNSAVAFALETVVTIRQVGAGITTIVAGAGVTINSPATLAIARTKGTVQLVQVATDVWDLMGDVT
jgi:hypothetical protein